MSTVYELEQAKEQAKELVKLRDMALKLYDNREFRKLVVEGYFTADAARFVHQSGDPALNEQQRADALAMAQAAGHFKRFLSATITMGNVAERQLGEFDEAIEDARAEEAGE